MRLTREFIQHLSARMVEHLTDRESIRTTVSPEDLSARIARVITEDLMVEDRLNEEVREVLSQHTSVMERGDINQSEMFKKVKRELAKKKGIIL